MSTNQSETLLSVIAAKVLNVWPTSYVPIRLVQLLTFVHTYKNKIYAQIEMLFFYLDSAAALFLAWHQLISEI